MQLPMHMENIFALPNPPIPIQKSEKRLTKKVKKEKTNKTCLKIVAKSVGKAANVSL